MKIINKTELVSLLKDIILKLETNKIIYEIPYMFINKNSYNYIDIIITNDIDTKELISMIICDNFKEKGNIIYLYKDDFLIRFIKTDSLFPNLIQYSWNILTPLVKIMCNNNYLEYNENGLYFKYEKSKILLSNDFKEIFNFFKISITSLLFLP